MEFDPDGNTVAAWGDRNVLPNGIHGCFVDYQDNIWIAGNGDGIVQKYTHSGNLLLQIGTRGVCDNPPANTCGNSGANPNANLSQTLLNQPADMTRYFDLSNPEAPKQVYEKNTGKQVNMIDAPTPNGAGSTNCTSGANSAPAAPAYAAPIANESSV